MRDYFKGCQISSFVLSHVKNDENLCVCHVKCARGTVYCLQEREREPSQECDCLERENLIEFRRAHAPFVAHNLDWQRRRWRRNPSNQTSHPPTGPDLKWAAAAAARQERPSLEERAKHKPKPSEIAATDVVVVFFPCFDKRACLLHARCKVHLIMGAIRPPTLPLWAGPPRPCPDDRGPKTTVLIIQ